MLGKAMGRAQQRVKMPCWEDVIGLAERLTQIEMAMGNLDPKLDLQHISAYSGLTPESMETTQIYLHADMQLKERRLGPYDAIWSCARSLSSY